MDKHYHDSSKFLPYYTEDDEPSLQIIDIDYEKHGEDMYIAWFVFADLNEFPIKDGEPLRGDQLFLSFRRYHIPVPDSIRKYRSHSKKITISREDWTTVSN